MAASNRYVGNGMVLTLGAVTISADYTKFDFAPQMKTVERTAANDTDASYNTTYKDGKWSLTTYDTGNTTPSGGSTALSGQLKPGTTGTLTVYPAGVGSGKEIFSFPVIVTECKIALEFDKNVVLDIQGLKNGAMIQDFGTTQ